MKKEFKIQKWNSKVDWKEISVLSFNQQDHWNKYTERCHQTVTKRETEERLYNWIINSGLLFKKSMKFHDNNEYWYNENVANKG